MILSKQYLGSHVSRGTTRLMTILWFPISRNAEISDSGISILIKNDVLRLDIAMYDVSLMEMVETLD